MKMVLAGLARPVLMFVCLAMSSFHLKATEITLCFDKLFPETVVKELHDTVLQLWSDVTLFHDKNIEECQKKDLSDMIAGQMVRIRYLLEHIQTKNHLLNHEDVDYLKSIMHSLSCNFDAFFAQKHIQPLWLDVSDCFALLNGV